MYSGHLESERRIKATQERRQEEKQELSGKWIAEKEPLASNYDIMNRSPVYFNSKGHHKSVFIRKI